MNWPLIEHVAGILGIAAAAVAFSHWLWKRFTRWLDAVRSGLPRKTVALFPIPNACRWGKATVNDKPAMQLFGDWTVTNITDKPIHVVAAFLQRPRVFGYVTLSEPFPLVATSKPIPPNHPMTLRLLFFVAPPRRKPGQDFKATVVVVDSYGNEHPIKAVFLFPEPPQRR